MWVITQTNYNPAGQIISRVNLTLTREESRATALMREEAETLANQNNNPVTHHDGFSEVTFTAGYHTYVSKEFIHISE